MFSKWTRNAIAVLVVVGTVAADEPGKRIVVTGRAAGTTPAAVEEARLDALREAVSRVCGAFLNAQSETADFALVRDKVLEQPVGFARVVRVMKGPAVNGEITEIQLEAEVFPAKFEQRWAEFAHVKQREGNPRCVIVILEDDDPTDANPPVTEGIVQAELEGFFLSKDVQVLNKGIADDVRQRDLRLAAESGDALKAAAAGAAFKADVVVVGTVEARRGESVVLEGHEIRRWNVPLIVRAIQTDSAAVLVSKTYVPSTATTSTTGSGKDALRRVARDNAAQVLSDIAAAWRKRATVGRTIQLTIERCPRRTFKAVQAAMVQQKGVTGGEDGFKLRELANDVATVDVAWKYDLDGLADRLEELELMVEGQAAQVRVTEQSANRITARVEGAGGPSDPGGGGERDSGSRGDE